MASVCEDLLSWASKHGAVAHAKLDMFGEGTHGARGVTVRETIKSGEELVRIPAALVISGHAAAQPDGALGQFYKSMTRPLSSVLRLTLTLVHELRVKKQDSRWWPYVHFLDATVAVETPLLWPSDALTALQGTSILIGSASSDATAQLPRDALNDTFQTEVLPIMAEGKELWPPECRNVELFSKCLMWVMSRSLQGELAYALDGNCLPSFDAGMDGKKQGPFMLPLFDLLNHSSWPDARGTTLRFENGAFIAYAERDLAAGDEVLISYGNHGDSELLRTYGFVEGDARGNPCNTLIVTEGEILAGCRKALNGDQPSENRIAFLKSFGILAPAYAIRNDGVLPPGLLTSVQVLMMNAEEYEEYTKSGVQVLGEQFHSRGTALANSVTVCTMQILAETRKRYNEQDEDGEEADERKAMAAQVRNGELEILRATQSYIITKLAPKAPSGRKAKVARKKKKVAQAATSQRGVEGEEAEAQSDEEQGDDAVATSTTAVSSAGRAGEPSVEKKITAKRRRKA